MCTLYRVGMYMVKLEMGVVGVNIPAIAQLVERLTVEVYAAIRRSLVRIRVAGLFFILTSLINLTL